MTRRRFLSAGVGALVGASAGALGADRRPMWVMPPPWPGNGRCLWEMVTREADWSKARKTVAGIGYWPWLMNQHYTDEQLRRIFAALRSWRVGLGFEVPVLKGERWGYDGKPLDAEAAFRQWKLFEERMLAAGMPEIRWFAFDEPIYAARHSAPKFADPADRLRHGAEQTAAFIGLMRRSRPRARLGPIEPYPALSADEIIGAVTEINGLCRTAKVRGPDFLRLDVDWSLFDRGSGSWEDVRKIAERCGKLRITFSLIYWAADQPRLPEREREGPLIWRDGVLRQAAMCRQAGIRPDEVVLESWLHVPQHAVPESDPTTFAASIRALEQAMREPARQ